MRTTRLPAATTTSTEAQPRMHSTQQGLALALLCLAQFMVVLDTTIVNVALPAIGTELGFESQGELQYVISLYALTFGGSMILAARSADLLGRRRAFITGVIAFAVASLACGFATAPAVLLTARAVQGLAAATISASALTLLTTMFAEGPARNRALGAWGAVGGAAGAVGLVLGGGITDVLGWPWVFYINVPIGLVVATGARHALSSGGARNEKAGLDLPGAVTVTTGLGLLVFGLANAEKDGFTASSTLGLLGFAFALLVVFVVIERRVQNPLVRFALLRLPGVAGANVIALLLTTIISSNLFFTTLYVQQVLGLSPLLTGLAFLPNSALVVVGSWLGSRLADRIDIAAVLAIGLAVLAASSLLLSGVSPNGGYVTDVLPGFALTGLGGGLLFLGVPLAATRGVADRDQGVASGLVNTALQIGFAVGIAAIVAAAAAGNSDVGPRRLVDGFATGYQIGAALAVFGVVLTVILVRERRPIERAH